MAAYTGGDDAAFRTLFERYAGRLTALMRRTVANDDDARELVQQTFLAFHRAHGDFEQGRLVRPWLYTIALNLRRDYHRRRGRNRELLVEEMPEPTQPPRGARRVDDAQAVELAMRELSEKRRAVVELHWFEGFSFAEIADALGISRSAAKVRAHRAYEQMRQALDDKEM